MDFKWSKKDLSYTWGMQKIISHGYSILGKDDEIPFAHDLSTLTLFCVW